MLPNFASILILFLGFVGVSTVDALRCQCTTDKGGVPCYNSWCQVYNNGTKVAACAMIRIGSIQHFACAHVSKDSTDSCKVVQKNGRDATKCWCRNEDYCNVELAERVDDDSPRHQQKTWESESSDVDQHDAPDMIIDKQYDVNDQVDEGDLSDEIDNQEVASNRIEENTFDMRPPELPKPSIDESIPPWRRRNPAAQEVVTPPPLPPLPGSHQRKITTTTTTTTTTPRTPSPEEQRRLYEEEWRRRHLEHENRRKKFEEEEEKRRQTHIQQQKLQYEATRRFAESSRGAENWPVPSQERSRSSEVGKLETSRTQRIEARIQSQDRSRSLQQRPETREDTPRSYVPNTETRSEQELAKSVSNVEPTTTLRVGLTRNNSVDRIITYSEIRDRFKKPEDSIQPKKDEIVYPPGAFRHAAKPLSTTTTTTTSTIPTTTTTTSTTTTPSTSTTTTTTTTTARTSTTTTTPSTTSTPTTTKTTVYRNSDESEEDDGEILFTTKKPVLKLKNVSSNDNEEPLPKSSAKIGGSIIVTLLFCIFVLSRGF